MDKFFGGVGLRRGRTNPDLIHVGDTIDFWRVLIADRDKGRLLLFALVSSVASWHNKFPLSKAL